MKRPVSQSRKRVLCADSSRRARAVWQRVLGPHCRIETVSSQTEAMQSLDRTPADVVISAWDLCEGQGPAFLAEVAERWPESCRVGIVDDGRWASAPSFVAQQFIPRHAESSALVRLLRLDDRDTGTAKGEIDVPG